MKELLKQIAGDKKKIFFIILLSIIVSYLDFAFIVRWQMRGIKNISTKTIRLKKDLNDLEKDLANMQDFKNKQAKIGQTLFLKTKKIISEDQIPTLLERIQDLANKNNIKIIKISPSKESMPEGQKVTAIGNYIPLSISLDLSSDYHHLGSFINNLEYAQIFLAVENLKIIRDSSDYLRQNVNLALKTYVKK